VTGFSRKVLVACASTVVSIHTVLSTRHDAIASLCPKSFNIETILLKHIENFQRTLQSRKVRVDPGPAGTGQCICTAVSERLAASNRVRSMCIKSLFSFVAGVDAIYMAGICQDPRQQWSIQPYHRVLTQPSPDFQCAAMRVLWTKQKPIGRVRTGIRLRFQLYWSVWTCQES